MIPSFFIVGIVVDPRHEERNHEGREGTKGKFLATDSTDCFDYAAQPNPLSVFPLHFLPPEP